MFRFFCTKCLKVKRVQHSARVIDLVNQFSDNPTHRIGVCKRHFENPIRKEKPIKSKKAEVIPIQSKKSRKAS